MVIFLALEGKAACGMGGSDLRRITRGQWLALAAALLGWMFDGFEQGVFGLVGRPALVDILDLKDDARIAADESAPGELRRETRERVEGLVGAWNDRVSASYLLGAAVGGWLFGWLGDRLGRVRAMVFSVLTYAIFTGLCGLAMGPWQMVGLRFLAALGMGGEWALGVALVMESWPQSMRPLLAGLIGAAANVGFMLNVVPVKLVERAADLPMDAGGWRWVLGACAFPAVLTFFLRVFVPESEKWRQAVQSGPQSGLTDIFTPALRRRSILAALLSGIPLLVTWGATASMVTVWARSMSDQNWANYTQMTSAFGAVLGTISGALVAHYLGRRRTYVVLLLGSLLSCLYLFVFHNRVDGWFLMAVGLTGFFTASFYGWLPLYLPELFPTRVRATGQGFGYNFGRTLAAAGALIKGSMMANVFHGSYAQAGAVISLIYLVGLVVIWLAPETRGQPLPE
ncbi:MAG TPA: MFS transporter [Gemmataceae bacterium]